MCIVWEFSILCDVLLYSTFSNPFKSRILIRSTKSVVNKQYPYGFTVIVALRDVSRAQTSVNKRENMIYVLAIFGLIRFPGSQVQGWVIHCFIFQLKLTKILISDGFPISGKPCSFVVQLIRNAMHHLSRV